MSIVTVKIITLREIARFFYIITKTWGLRFMLSEIKKARQVLGEP